MGGLEYYIAVLTPTKRSEELRAERNKQQRNLVQS